MCKVRQILQYLNNDIVKNVFKIAVYKRSEFKVLIQNMFVVVVVDFWCMYNLES